jgi:pimeloyl-ACP methyl ester carboxylesterase/DNA-binding winged helix-turn-helix (wHTH) protein
MTYEFANCVLDETTHRLSLANVPVHVEPQVFDLLMALARVAPGMLSYDDMIEQVWHGRIVSDATLSARISSARTAVGDSGKAQAVIRTIPRRGVQMACPVKVTGEAGGVDDVTPLHIHSSAPHQIIRYAASADGTDIAYAVSGDEGPPLLRGAHWISHLEHDWTSPVWRPWLKRLGAGRRLIRYDVRGTGLSERQPARRAQEDFVADMAAVINASGADAVDIFAASQSVPIALAFAALWPERVRRIVLVNGFVQGSYVRGHDVETDTMIAMIRAGWGIPGSPFVKAVATVFMPRASEAERASFVEMQTHSASRDEAAAMRNAVGRFDVTEILSQVTAPVLVMSSEGDAVNPQAQSRLLARALPNAEFRSLETDNHAIAPSDPAFLVMMDAMDRFLAR